MKASETAIRSGAWSLLWLARRQAGISQRELARRAGTSPAAVSRYEQAAATPDLPTLQRLIRACGFDLRLDLAPIDDHDAVLIEHSLRRTPAERAADTRAHTRTMERVDHGRPHQQPA